MATTSQASQQSQGGRETDGGGQVDTLSVQARLSDFWPAYPRLWFTHFEAVMGPQKQGDEVRYQAAIARLGLDALQQISDIVANPPAENKYEAIKSRLISAYEESETRKLQKLMEEMELGDQKPSQLLRKMRELAVNKISDDTLRMMWSKLLPPSVRAVLSISDSPDLDKLSRVADTVMDSVTPRNQVAQISSANSANEMFLLRQKLEEISLELAELKHQGRSRGRSQGRSQSRNRYRQRSVSPNGSWMCYYHRRFGAKSTRCKNRQDCSFEKSQQQSEN